MGKLYICYLESNAIEWRDKECELNEKEVEDVLKEIKAYSAELYTFYYLVGSISSTKVLFWDKNTDKLVWLGWNNMKNFIPSYSEMKILNEDFPGQGFPIICEKNKTIGHKFLLKFFKEFPLDGYMEDFLDYTKDGTTIIQWRELLARVLDVNLDDERVKIYHRQLIYLIENIGFSNEDFVIWHKTYIDNNNFIPYEKISTAEEKFKLIVDKLQDAWIPCNVKLESNGEINIECGRDYPDEFLDRILNILGIELARDCDFSAEISSSRTIKKERVAGGPGEW